MFYLYTMYIVEYVYIYTQRDIFIYLFPYLCTLRIFQNLTVTNIATGNILMHIS